MRSPVQPEDVKIIQGRSKGLQVMCSCGCVNFNYLDPQDPMWRCRNCRLVISYDFPRLLERAEALERQQVAAVAPGTEGHKTEAGS